MIFTILTFQNHLKEGYGSGTQIHDTGCLVTMESWFNLNLYYIGGTALGVAVVQVNQKYNIILSFRRTDQDTC